MSSPKSLVSIIVSVERATTLIRGLAQLIRAERRLLGVTQAQMAARCGLSGKYFGQLERGEVDASLSTLECLAQGFQKSLSDILSLSALSDRNDRPTLDYHDLLRILETLPLITAHFDQLASRAKAAGGGSGASPRNPPPPTATGKKPLRSPKGR